MINITCSYNYAYYSGGCLDARHSGERRGSLEITGSRLSHNFARVKGGSLYSVADVDTTIRESEITHSEAYSGGSMYIQRGARVEVASGSTISSNVAEVGGVMFLDDYKSSLVMVGSSSVSFNRATRGGVFAGVGVVSVVDPSRFESNVALTPERSSINTASRLGTGYGGLYYYTDRIMNPLVDGCKVLSLGIEVHVEATKAYSAGKLVFFPRWPLLDSRCDSVELMKYNEYLEGIERQSGSSSWSPYGSTMIGTFVQSIKVSGVEGVSRVSVTVGKPFTLEVRVFDHFGSVIAGSREDFNVELSVDDRSSSDVVMLDGHHFHHKVVDGVAIIRVKVGWVGAFPMASSVGSFLVVTLSNSNIRDSVTLEVRSTCDGEVMTRVGNKSAVEFGTDDGIYSKPFTYVCTSERGEVTSFHDLSVGLSGSIAALCVGVLLVGMWCLFVTFIHYSSPLLKVKSVGSIVMIQLSAMILAGSVLMDIVTPASTSKCLYLLLLPSLGYHCSLVFAIFLLYRITRVFKPMRLKVVAFPQWKMMLHASLLLSVIYGVVIGLAVGSEIKVVNVMKPASSLWRFLSPICRTVDSSTVRSFVAVNHSVVVVLLCVFGFFQRRRYAFNVDPKYIPLVINVVPLTVIPALVVSLGSYFMSYLTMISWHHTVMACVNLLVSVLLTAVNYMEMRAVVAALTARAIAPSRFASADKKGFGGEAVKVKSPKTPRSKSGSSIGSGKVAFSLTGFLSGSSGSGLSHRAEKSVASLEKATLSGLTLDSSSREYYLTLLVAHKKKVAYEVGRSGTVLQRVSVGLTATKTNITKAEAHRQRAYLLCFGFVQLGDRRWRESVLDMDSARKVIDDGFLWRKLNTLHKKTRLKDILNVKIGASNVAHHK